MSTFDSVVAAFCRKASTRLAPVTELGRTQRRLRLKQVGLVVSAMLGTDVQFRPTQCPGSAVTGAGRFLVGVIHLGRQVVCTSRRG